jgi:hypothetical protein
MKPFGIAFLLLSLLGVSGLVEGQSLGSVAKKEKERREKNKQQGVAVREISEKEIFGEDNKPEEKAEEASEAEDENTGETPKRLSVPDRIDVPVGDEPAASSTDERAERRRSEIEWRSRIQQARERVAVAKQRVEFFKNLNLPVGGRYVDAQGRTVIESLDHLRRLVKEANQELAEAEQALKALQEEARHAGVPPGWLR